MIIHKIGSIFFRMGHTEIYTGAIQKYILWHTYQAKKNPRQGRSGWSYTINETPPSRLPDWGSITTYSVVPTQGV